MPNPLASNKEKSTFQQLRQNLEVKRIRVHSARLSEALENPPLRKLLAQANGRVIETARVRPLEERAVRAARAEIFALIGIAESIGDRATRSELFRTTLPLFGEALGFQGGEWSVSKATVQALGTIWGDDKIVSLLAYIAERHKDMIVSRAAVVQLTKIGGDEAFRVLTHALGSRDRDIPRLAEEALEHRQNYRQAVPALENGLRHASPEVRRRSAAVLDRLNWIPQAPDGEGWRAVAKRHWPEAIDIGAEAVPALENALKGKQSSIREEAAAALEMLAWQPKQYALRAWYLVARRRWDEAADLKISATAALANALDDEDETVSSAAADCLARIGPYAVPALAGALHEHHEANLQQKASKVLGAIARNAPDGRDPRISTLFIDAVPALTEAVADAHNRILLEPARALADIADNIFEPSQIESVFEDALSRIREAIDGQHPVIRKELEMAHCRILTAANRAQSKPASAFIGLTGRSGSRK